jgi:hypothetical protein
MIDDTQKSQLLIYEAENGAIKIDVRFDGETVWLTQQLMADLFQTTQHNISLHLRNIYEESELLLEATHKEFLSVRREGLREVERSRDYYNLDGFLALNERGILTHAGKISHELAASHAQQHYDSFHQHRLVEQAGQPDDFEKALSQLPVAKPRPKKKGGAK